MMSFDFFYQHGYHDENNIVNKGKNGGLCASLKDRLGSLESHVNNMSLTKFAFVTRDKT